MFPTYIAFIFPIFSSQKPLMSVSGGKFRREKLLATSEGKISLHKLVALSQQQGTYFAQGKWWKIV
jgi:hypothetical protein